MIRNGSFGFAALLALIVPSFGAAPLEIIPVRMPADRVGSSFPEGTEFKVLRRDQFESLVERLRAEEGRRQPSVPPWPTSFSPT